MVWTAELSLFMLPVSLMCVWHRHKIWVHPAEFMVIPNGHADSILFLGYRPMKRRIVEPAWSGSGAASAVSREWAAASTRGSRWWTHSAASAAASIHGNHDRDHSRVERVKWSTLSRHSHQAPQWMWSGSTFAKRDRFGSTANNWLNLRRLRTRCCDFIPYKSCDWTSNKPRAFDKWVP